VGWLLSRCGIIKSMLLLPGLLVLSSAAALASPTLMMAAASNFILLTLSETLDMPAQELLFLPLSPRLRLRAQTLVDGALNPIGHGIGGALLLLLMLVHMKVEHVALVVAVVAAVWLALIFIIQPQYQKTLAASLRQRHFKPLDLEALLKRGDSIAVLSEHLGSDNPGLALSAMDLLQGRPLGDLAGAIVRLTASRHEEVAVRALDLLGSQGGREDLPAVRQALQNNRIPVRRSALLALCRIAREDAVCEAAAYLDSAQPPLRTAALLGLARHGGFDGALLAYPRLETLLRSAADDDRIEAAAVLGHIGISGVARVMERLLADPALPVRQEALRSARLLRSPRLVPGLLRALDDPRLRPLAVQALGALPQDAAGALLGALQDRGRDYSQRAALAWALCDIGGPDAPAALWGLLSPDEDIRLRLNAAESLRRLKFREGLHGFALDGFEARLEQLRDSVALLQQARREIGGDGAAAGLFFAEHARLHIELILNLLSLRYDARQLQRIAAYLFGKNAALRANAVELLEVILPRATAKPLVPLLCDGDGVRAVSGGTLSPDTIRKLLRADAWTRAITTFHLAQEGAWPGSLGGETMNAQDLNLNKVLTTVSFLKQVGLFRNVPANHLASVANIVEEKSLYAGETLFAQGDVGDSLYLICAGRIRVLVGGKEAAQLGPRDHVGEMALLDGQPRSATAVVTEDARLLRIAADEFRNLLASHPGIALALLEAMAQRLRETMAQGRAGAPDAALAAGC